MLQDINTPLMKENSTCMHSIHEGESCFPTHMLKGMCVCVCILWENQVKLPKYNPIGHN